MEKFESAVVRLGSRLEALAPPFFILMLIFCATYFVELATFPLSIDEENRLFRSNWAAWIATGRWGAFLIEELIISRPVLPFLPMIVLGIGCVLSFMLILNRIDPLKQRPSLADYVSFAVFCGFPTWFFIAEFYTNVGALGFGYLAATASVWVLPETWGLSRRNALLAASGVLLSAFAVGVYQSLFFLVLSLSVAFCVVLETGRFRDRLTGLSLNMTVAIAGLLLSLLIGQLFKLLFNLDSTYLNAFFDFGSLYAVPVEVTLRFAGEVAAVYGFDGDVYRISTWATPVLLAAGFAALWLKEGRRGRLLVAGALGCILLIPFALNLSSRGAVPIRTLIAVPFAVWLCCHLGLTSRLAWIRAATAVVLPVALFQYQVLQNSNQALNSLVARHDSLVAASIYERLSDLSGRRVRAVQPIAVFGGRQFKGPYQSAESSTAGASFFGWDGGNARRISNYMKALGIRMRPAREDEIAKIDVDMSRMPIWPAKGSVTMSAGVLLVRLGKEPGHFSQPPQAQAAEQGQ